jgi:hypothetical protein
MAVSILVYGSEYWAMKWKRKTRNGAAEMKCVRTAKYNLMTYIWNEDVLKEIKHNLNWTLFMRNWLDSVPVWWPGLKNSPTVTHACRKRRLKWVRSTWGYNWVTLFPGAINTETWSFRLGGLGAGLTIQSRKKVIVKKPQKGRRGPDLGCRAIWWWWWWWWWWLDSACWQYADKHTTLIQKSTTAVRGTWLLDDDDHYGDYEFLLLSA